MRVLATLRWQFLKAIVSCVQMMLPRGSRYWPPCELRCVYRGEAARLVLQLAPCVPLRWLALACASLAEFVKVTSALLDSELPVVDADALSAALLASLITRFP